MNQALELHDVRKAFGKREVVRGISLEIPKGAIYGLLGPNGSGKTTLLRMVMGLLSPSSGRVRLLGQFAPGQREAQRNIGYMPQSIALYPGLSALENIRFFGRLYGLDATTLEQRARNMLELVELSGRRDELVRNLSGGMARRVMLASAMVHDPALLILDEPTAGVDPGLRLRFWAWFRELASAGTAILITTHHISEAKDAEQVLFLREGRLLTQGHPEQIMAAHDARDLEEAFVRATEQRAQEQTS